MRTRYRVAATTRLGARRLIYWRGGASFSWRRGKTGRAWMPAGAADAAKRWATRRLARNVRAYPPGRYPFLELVPGTLWPSDRGLLRRLNAVGAARKRTIRIVSGRRTLAQQQALYDKYQRYLRGGPYANLAAYPNERAPHIRGVAADCGVLGRTGGYTSLGLDAKARRKALALGLRALVPGEPWHWQRAATYH